MLHRSRIAHRTIAIIAVLLALGNAALAYTAAKPAKANFMDAFSGVSAWGPFGMLAADEPTTKTSKSVPLLQLTDSSGKSVAIAQWDGSDPKVSADGREWTMILSTTVGLRKMSYELKSSWTEETKLAGGRMDLTVTYLGEAEQAAKYSYLLRLPGSGAWASKDGKSAAVASMEGFAGNVADFLALTPIGGSCTFKARQIEKKDSAKADRKLSFIEASSVAPKQGEAAKAQVMGIYMAQVRAWSYEPVLALVTAMNSGAADPDVRIFGTVDKQAASPGESLKYTYFLFNAGMDEATDLNVNIPISDKTGLVTDSIYGSPGTATLMPRGEAIQIKAEEAISGASDRSIRSIQWRPEGNLMPGETVEISFSVVI